MFGQRHPESSPCWVSKVNIHVKTLMLKETPTNCGLSPLFHFGKKIFADLSSHWFWRISKIVKNFWYKIQNALSSKIEKKPWGRQKARLLNKPQPKESNYSSVDYRVMGFITDALPIHLKHCIKRLGNDLIKILVIILSRTSKLIFSDCLTIFMHAWLLLAFLVYYSPPSSPTHLYLLIFLHLLLFLFLPLLLPILLFNLPYSSSSLFFFL